MTIEEAMFYKIMLRAGDADLYYAWIDEKTNTEDPMNEETVELYFCGTDINKIISYLHNYCLDQDVDEQLVLDKIWKALNNYYVHKSYSMERILDIMDRIGYVIEEEGFSLDEPAYTLCCMQEIYEEAEEGIISMEGFERFFEDFIMKKKGITEWREQQNKNYSKIKTLKYVKAIRVLLTVYNLECAIIVILFLFSNIFDNRMLFVLADKFVSLIFFNPVTIAMAIVSFFGMKSYIKERKNIDYKILIGKKWIWLVECFAIQFVMFLICAIAITCLTGGV